MLHKSGHLRQPKILPPKVRWQFLYLFFPAKRAKIVHQTSKISEGRLKGLEEQAKAMREEVSELRNMIEALQNQRLQLQLRAKTPTTTRRNTPAKKKTRRKSGVDDEMFSEEEPAAWPEDWDAEDREWGSDVGEGRSIRSSGKPKAKKPPAKSNSRAPPKSKAKTPTPKSKGKKPQTGKQAKKPKTPRSGSDSFPEDLSDGTELIFSPTSYHVTSVASSTPISAIAKPVSRSKTVSSLGQAQQQIQEVQALLSQQEHILDGLKESPFKSFFEETELASAETKNEHDHETSSQHVHQQQLLMLQRQQQHIQQQQRQQQLQHQLQHQFQQQIQRLPQTLQEQTEATDPFRLISKTVPVQNPGLQAQLLKAQLQAQIDPAAAQHAQLLQQWTNGASQWAPNPMTQWGSVMWPQPQATATTTTTIRLPVVPQTSTPSDPEQAQALAKLTQSAALAEDAT